MYLIDYHEMRRALTQFVRPKKIIQQRLATRCIGYRYFTEGEPIGVYATMVRWTDDTLGIIYEMEDYSFYKREKGPHVEAPAIDDWTEVQPRVDRWIEK